MFSLWLHDFLEDEFKFWEIVDRKSGRGGKKKRENPNRCRPQKKKKKSSNNTELISGNCALCWSAEITNPRSCVQGRKVSSSPECIIQEKRFNNTWTSRSGRRASEKSFFSSLLSACLHTLQRGGGGSWHSPRSCASDVSSNVSSRKWWRCLSPAVRFQGSGGKVEAVPPPRGHLGHVQHLCAALLSHQELCKYNVHHDILLTLTYWVAVKHW